MAIRRPTCREVKMVYVVTIQSPEKQVMSLAQDAFFNRTSNGAQAIELIRFQLILLRQANLYMVFRRPGPAGKALPTPRGVLSSARGTQRVLGAARATELSGQVQVGAHPTLAPEAVRLQQRFLPLLSWPVKIIPVVDGNPLSRRNTSDSRQVQGVSARCERARRLAIMLNDGCFDKQSRPS